MQMIVTYIAKVMILEGFSVQTNPFLEEHRMLGLVYFQEVTIEVTG